MVVSSKGLQFTSLGILYHTDSIVNRDSVMQSCCRSLHLDGAIGKDLWLLPATIFGPVDAQHVVREHFAKGELISLGRLDFPHIDLFD